MYISHNEVSLDSGADDGMKLPLSHMSSADDFTVDISGKIVGACLIARGPTRYSKSDVIGQKISIFYADADNGNDLFRSDLQQASSRGEFTTYGTRVRKNGESFFARMDFYAFRNEKEKTIGYRLTIGEFQDHRGDQRQDSMENISYSLMKLPIPTRNGYLFIPFKDIMRCQSNLNYTTFFLLDGTKIISSKNMGHFAELLRPVNFIRIHKSDTINLAYIKSFSRTDGGMITLSDDTVLPLSKTYRTDFLSKLNLNFFEKLNS